MTNVVFFTWSKLGGDVFVKQQRFSSETGLIAACGFAPKENPSSVGCGSIGVSKQGVWQVSQYEEAK
jgi:hypothetical protein